MRLTNKVVLVTGATRGIGRAIAMLFAKEGAQTIVHGTSRDRGQAVVGEIQDEGGEATFISADVSSEAEVRTLVGSCVARYGRLDVLCTSAGAFAPGEDGSIEMIKSRAMDYIIDVNLKGVLWCCKYALPALIRGGGGSIVNIASVNALTGMPGADIYTATKGGVVALTRAIAVQHGENNVRANAICPGPIDTELLRRDPKYQVYRQFSALRRLGSPEDVAFAALYLASDESAWVTGSVLVVDGGMTSSGVWSSDWVKQALGQASGGVVTLNGP